MCEASSLETVVLHVVSLVFPKLPRKPVPSPGYFSGTASLRG
ncbi:unnamed protein product [Penicillium roqueforti FM164]|uniref:Genomic scaffold, ProqFM164S02 n=1 Tax=Penicillium roqueforti (strain FM164) TaxID=1365484 RepID=W6QAC1_PENRF|nr:unnamed protein product [Penicillium roqueforti FM164]